MKNKIKHHTLFSGEPYCSSANQPNLCSQSLAGKSRAGRKELFYENGDSGMLELKNIHKSWRQQQEWRSKNGYSK